MVSRSSSSCSTEPSARCGTPALILASVPLALLGGLAALHLRGMTLNVSSAVGFITLFGVAVQNGVIMVSALNRARDAGLPLAVAVARGASSACGRC